jgi:hypothetical protein
MRSVAASAVAWVVFGLAAQVGSALGVAAGLVTLFGSRTLAGAAGGNIAAAQAYVADVTPREGRAGALGLVGAAFSLGFVFGPALGGLAASDPVVAAADRLLPSLVPTTRFSLPSFLAAALSLCALAAAAVVLREPDRTRRAGRGDSLVAGFQRALADDALRPLVLSFFVASLAFAGIQVMFIPFAADVYGYGATEVALFLTYVGVLGAVNQGLLVGRLERALGAAKAGVERYRLVNVDAPEPIHNGGTLEFGPSGYLYASLGNGGGSEQRNAHDGIGQAQYTGNVLGPIMRMDVDRPEANFAAPTNPFAGRETSGDGRIHAYGLRNP